MRSILVAAFVACSAPEEYVFSAVHIDEANACIQGTVALDVMSGRSSSCTPWCLARDSALFVSATCPPGPLGYEPVSGARCDAALAIEKTKTRCPKSS